MKPVHDILNLRLSDGLVTTGERKNRFIPVAFIQWGPADADKQYEFVCPYCSKSIGWSQPEGDMEQMQLDAATAITEHYKARCEHWGAARFDVTKASAPLNTQHLPEGM